MNATKLFIAAVTCWAWATAFFAHERECVAVAAVPMRWGWLPT
jgi:hypothetical protein